jgi:hypothetical protein
LTIQEAQTSNSPSDTRKAQILRTAVLSQTERILAEHPLLKHEYAYPLSNETYNFLTRVISPISREKYIYKTYGSPKESVVNGLVFLSQEDFWDEHDILVERMSQHLKGIHTALYRHKLIAKIRVMRRLSVILGDDMLVLAYLPVLRNAGGLLSEHLLIRILDAPRLDTATVDRLTMLTHERLVVRKHKIVSSIQTSLSFLVTITAPLVYNKNSRGYAANKRMSAARARFQN